MKNLIEAKPYEVMADEAADIQNAIEERIRTLCSELEQEQKLLECIKSTRQHYLEMAQNG